MGADMTHCKFDTRAWVANSCRGANDRCNCDCAECIAAKDASQKQQVMIYEGGGKSSYHCTDRDERNHVCGCNVFAKLESGRYRCNACGTIYEGR
jgi:hypothetical protein